MTHPAVPFAVAFAGQVAVPVRGRRPRGFRGLRGAVASAVAACSLAGVALAGAGCSWQSSIERWQHKQELRHAALVADPGNYSDVSVRVLDGETGLPLPSILVQTAYRGQFSQPLPDESRDQTDYNGVARLRLFARGTGCRLAVNGFQEYFSRAVILFKADVTSGEVQDVYLYRRPWATSVLEVPVGYRGLLRVAWPPSGLTQTVLHPIAIVAGIGGGSGPRPAAIPPAWEPGQRVFVTRLPADPDAVVEPAAPPTLWNAVPTMEYARFADGRPLPIEQLPHDWQSSAPPGDAADAVAIWPVAFGGVRRVQTGGVDQADLVRPGETPPHRIYCVGTPDDAVAALRRLLAGAEGRPPPFARTDAPASANVAAE